MNNSEDILTTVTIKRIECVASGRSSFYTLSNRIIVPGFYISALVTIPLSVVPLIITLLAIVWEIMIKYAFRLSTKELFVLITNKTFGSQHKNVKN
jgi:hypothetical protein